MTTTQIYSVVNALAQQSLGVSDIEVVDTSSLISLGNIILSSTQNTESFLNTLVQRIGRTIYSYRSYKNKLSDMVINDFEYGAILQKIKVNLVSAQSDPAYELTEGKSVDHYKVNKPDIKQHLFVTRTPYMFVISKTLDQLKEAFQSAENMGAFMGLIDGEIRNSIELSLENLGHAAIANFIAESGSREIKLVSDYNNERGTQITATNALNNADFLLYAISRMKETLDGMTDLSRDYNDGTADRHTPYEDARIKILSKLERRLETVVQYAAFNKEYASLAGYSILNYWQSKKTPTSIEVKRASDKEDTTVENIVAVIYDRDALGIYKKDETVLTTPINAFGMYYNTAWHEKQLWYNDLSENFVYFTLN